MDDLIKQLEARFAAHPERHKKIKWADVLARLEAAPAKLKTLKAMEESGGEPDVVGFEDGQYLFYDCSPETPSGRVSLCFDDEALAKRKHNKPAGSAWGMAEEMGAEILNESEYRALQKLGEFDRKTSSWIATPAEIRKLGGGLFCDRRYDTVFVYHNGVQSYYASRGFRASVRV